MKKQMADMQKSVKVAESNQVAFNTQASLVEVLKSERNTIVSSIKRLEARMGVQENFSTELALCVNDGREDLNFFGKSCARSGSA